MFLKITLRPVVYGYQHIDVGVTRCYWCWWCSLWKCFGLCIAVIVVAFDLKSIEDPCGVLALK